MMYPLASSYRASFSLDDVLALFVLLTWRIKMIGIWLFLSSNKFIIWLLFYFCILFSLPNQEEIKVGWKESFMGVWSGNRRIGREWKLAKRIMHMQINKSLKFKLEIYDKFSPTSSNEPTLFYSHSKGGQIHWENVLPCYNNMGALICGIIGIFQQ